MILGASPAGASHPGSDWLAKVPAQGWGQEVRVKQVELGVILFRLRDVLEIDRVELALVEGIAAALGLQGCLLYTSPSPRD